MSGAELPPGGGSDAPLDRPGRRKRYRGTHPRRFDERYKELQPEAYPGIAEHVRERGMTPAGTHVPILVAEVLAALRPAPGEIVVDCTLGYGGHAEALAERVGPTGHLIGIDVDGEQLERTRARLGGRFPWMTFHRSSFAGVAKVLAAEGRTACDALLADLGVSSMQIDDPRRGFSYKHDGPLDMRMDVRRGRTAAETLRAIDEDELAGALRALADEPDAARIARAIVRGRERTAIVRTKQLARVVLEAKGMTEQEWRERRDARPGDLHPAARTFQALRVLVNDEMGALEQLLRVGPYCLRPGGRMAVITFHSGEERRVRESLAAGRRAGVWAETSDEPLRPGHEEVHANPRSRSARLHWARRQTPGTGVEAAC